MSSTSLDRFSKLCGLSPKVLVYMSSATIIFTHSLPHSTTNISIANFSIRKLHHHIVMLNFLEKRRERERERMQKLPLKNRRTEERIHVKSVDAESTTVVRCGSSETMVQAQAYVCIILVRPLFQITSCFPNSRAAAS
ncbi:hypothetical protein TNCV_1064031 [Trichonephila clavipes]|nr:hypothetical protein TNCV_1064031 [Trichonephila clavipes]